MFYILVGLCAVSILLNIVLASYNHRVVHWANYWKLEALRSHDQNRELYRMIFEDGGQDDKRGV